jgi:cyclopropane fatty-acyl-phospholipid synthase-like methyltransferase
MIRMALLAALTLLVTLAGCGPEGRKYGRNHDLDVPYLATPEPVVTTMLDMAQVGAGDVVYDLGSGDGRIPIIAAKDYAARAVGIELDGARVATARANAIRAGVADRVTFRQQDLFQADLREASVVTLFLLQGVNRRLFPKLLRELRPGTRIVSHAFTFGGWPPQQSRSVNGNMVYLWVVPPR